MLFSEEFLDSLRESCNIVDIVSGYVSLVQKGHNCVGLCPFHSEKTPSFFVYTNTNSFYCFGCGVGGDSITFIMLIEKLQYKEAVEFLANKFGIQLPESGSNDYFEKKTLLYEINRAAASFFYSCLTTNRNNLGFEYLLKRNVLPRTMTHFGLGYSHSKGSDLVNYLRKKNFSDDIIVQSNLGVKNKDGVLRDRFINRVMFPIISPKGNITAFGARSINNIGPKYLNTSDTLIFKKSENLFSLNFAKKEKYLILSEGYLDVISLHQLGFKSAVSSLGTSLTYGQAKLISRYTDLVYLCYDSDTAGRKATDRAIRILKNENIRVKIISIEDAKDPDEFVRKNKDKSVFKFNEMIKSAKSDIEFKISTLESKFDTDKSDEKIIFLNEVIKIISDISDPVERDVYSSKICSKYGVSRNIFEVKVSKIPKDNNKSSRFIKIDNKKLNKHNKQEYIEEFLIFCIMKNTDFTKSVDDLKSEDFCDILNFKILEKVRILLSEGKSVDISSIVCGFNLKGSSRVSKIANLLPINDISDSAFLDCVQSFKINKKLRKLKSCHELDNEEVLSFLDKIKKSKI